MTRKVVERAPAKVNLALHVVGRRADGYHLLDSLVAFAALGDTVTLRRADDLRLTVEGPFLADVPEDGTNLMMKAARVLGERLGDDAVRCHMTLDKRLPVASGIGGGSSDAAAAIRGLHRLNGRPCEPGELHAACLGLGADVPVCLIGTACRMSGIGDVIEPLALPGPLDAVLANPRAAVSTAQVFAGLGLQPGEAAGSRLPDLRAPTRGALLDWLAGCRNDLEEPAIALAPVIADALTELRRLPGCRLARMSGSGATCFALFDSAGEAHDAAARLSRERPGWWIEQTTLQ